MKKIILVILLLILCLPAIAHKHKHKTQHEGPRILSVAMRRTGCYGRCPDYSVKIDQSGLVTYTGRFFVTDTGIFQKNISSQKADSLIEQFYLYQVDTCQNTYNNRISDLPGLILTVQYDSYTKTINNAHFGPHFLSMLSGQIDDLGKKTDSLGWIKVKH